MLAILVTGVPKRFGLIHDGGIRSPRRVLCVGTRYGGIHLPTFVILFRQYINRNIMSPKHVARWMESGCGIWMWMWIMDVDVDYGYGFFMDLV